MRPRCFEADLESALFLTICWPPKKLLVTVKEPKAFVEPFQAVLRVADPSLRRLTLVVEELTGVLPTSWYLVPFKVLRVVRLLFVCWLAPCNEGREFILFWNTKKFGLAVG